MILIILAILGILLGIASLFYIGIDVATSAIKTVLPEPKHSFSEN
jgi:hypothetical protein